MTFRDLKNGNIKFQDFQDVSSPAETLTLNNQVELTATLDCKVVFKGVPNFKNLPTPKSVLAALQKGKTTSYKLAYRLVSFSSALIAGVSSDLQQRLNFGCTCDNAFNADEFADAVGFHITDGNVLLMSGRLEVHLAAYRQNG